MHEHLVPTQRRPTPAVLHRSWAAEPTTLTQAVDLLAGFTRCAAAVVAQVVLARARRSGESPEQLAGRLLLAMDGDGAEDERLVVSLVEAVLSADDSPVPAGPRAAGVGLSRRRRRRVSGRGPA